MLERFKAMPPEEQTQFVARMKERGIDTSAFEALWRRQARAGSSARAAPAARPQAQTIDALFAPLPLVESRGRAWLFVDRQLKPVNLRLGITDGTNTELLSGELQRALKSSPASPVWAPTRVTPTPAAPAIR